MFNWVDDETQEMRLNFRSKRLSSQMIGRSLHDNNDHAVDAY